MALLGCHVIATDQVEVLPLLMRNVERNMARAKHSPSQNPYLGSLGTIEVMELNWGDEDQIKALKPPFDYIIGSDIVYKEQLLDPLVSTLIGLAGPKSTIILANEYRSSTVHEKMLQLWKENFHMKIIPRSKMDPVYQHECIQLFVLRPKVDSSTSTIKQSMDHAVRGRASRGTEIITENNITYGPNSAELDGATKMMPLSISDDANIHDTQESEGLYNEPTSVDDISIHEQREAEGGRLNDWEMRRIGSMAARLLQNISCGDSE
ncbi:hypothetical protein KP509_26G031500 [Ceratopteris richardii]|nr:hypothetical protein KP509_26G031500 [Ceratopteris richardii]